MSPKRRGSGEGSIYQRADGLWCGSVNLGLINGKRTRKVVAAKTRADARDKMRALQLSLEMGVVPAKSTTAEWVNYWADIIAATKVRPNSLENIRKYARNWIVPCVGHVQLQKLAPDHVRAMHKTMLDAGKSTATVRQAHNILQRALRVALDEQRVLRNVAQIAGAPTPKDNPHKHLSMEDSLRVLTAADTARARARLVCALILGMRQGEVLGLRWSDVTFSGENGWITIGEAVQRQKGKGMVRTSVKSAASKRVVPLPEVAVLALARWREESGEGYIFYGRAGTDSPDDQRRDWGAWKDALARAGVPDVPLHGARGSTATLLLQLGVPERIIADILGHGTVRTTNEHYLHSDDAQRRAALELLGQRLALPGE